MSDLNQDYSTGARLETYPIWRTTSTVRKHGAISPILPVFCRFYLCDAIMLIKPSMVRPWATGIKTLEVAIVIVNFARDARMNTVNTLRDLMLKPAGPWMDPYFHLSIYCILIVFYCGVGVTGPPQSTNSERSGPSGHFQRHDVQDARTYEAGCANVVIDARTYAYCSLGLLLLTRSNFNPSIDT